MGIVERLMGDSGNDEPSSAHPQIIKVISQGDIARPERMPDKLRKWCELVAWKITLVRGQRGLSREQLAKVANLPTEYIASVEAASLSPSSFALEKIARALCIPEDDLLCLPLVQLDKTIHDRVRAWAAEADEIVCVVGGLRGETPMFVMTAAHDDPDGKLHDALCDLELEVWDVCGIPPDFILLRASEAGSEDSFLGPQNRRLVKTAAP